MPNGDHSLDSKEPSPYIELDREAWAELGQQADSPLTQDEILSLRGLGDALDLREVQEVYLTISRLLSLYVGAAGSLHREPESFLHRPTPPRTSPPPPTPGNSTPCARGAPTPRSSPVACPTSGSTTCRWPGRPNGSGPGSPNSARPGSTRSRGRQERRVSR